MIAAPSLCSSSSTASSHLTRDRVLRRSSSLPPFLTSRSPRTPKFSASCASAAEREHDSTVGGGNCNYSYYSRSYSSSVLPSASEVAGGTLYDVLGLAAGATAHEIKAAYRRLARSCHPDVAAGGRSSASADQFMRVHAAYATLSDPDKRAEYDSRVMPSVPRRQPPIHWSSFSSSASYCSPPSSSSAFGFPRRTWETDQCW